VPARLTLYLPDQPARQLPLHPGREYLIGRGPDCDLAVADPRLSRRHARIALADGCWRFDDLGSKNGTTLACREASDTKLRDGDWISFGGLLAQFADLSDRQLADEQVRERTRRQATMDRSQRLDPRAGVGDLLREVLHASMELAGAERGFVMLMDGDGKLQVRAEAGGIDPARPAPDFPGSRGALARAISTRAPVVVCDASADTLLGVQPSIVAGQIRALACLPLVIGGEVTGLVYLDSRIPGKVFTRLDVEILEVFAARAALVIGVASVREDLASLPRLVAPAAGRGSRP
jgi:pSer/pThr/pTyr-binding forkhead associated (FHA) protein